MATEGNAVPARSVGHRQRPVNRRVPSGIGQSALSSGEQSEWCLKQAERSSAQSSAEGGLKGPFKGGHQRSAGQRKVVHQRDWCVDRSTTAGNTEKVALIEAIRSLYWDRLEPLDHHVRRRIEEHTGTRWTPQRLMNVAQAVPDIQIEEELPKCKRRLYLCGETRDFVNQTACEDPYPTALWNELREFISSHKTLCKQTLQMSSRYDVAKLLHEHMAVLQDYKLGEACHVVQLAIQLHQILGYRDGRIVPYQESRDYEKQSNAESCQPTGMQGSGRFVKDWAAAQSMLMELLNHPASASGLELSSLKVHFRRHFGCDLNETVLGHTKLSTLITDPRFTQVCRVEYDAEIRLFRAEPNFCEQQQLGTGTSRSSRRRAAAHLRRRQKGEGKGGAAESSSPLLDDLSVATSSSQPMVTPCTMPTAAAVGAAAVYTPPHRRSGAYHGATAAARALRWSDSVNFIESHDTPMPRFPNFSDAPDATPEKPPSSFHAAHAPQGSDPTSCKQPDSANANPSDLEGGGVYEYVTVYEPVISWRAHVVRTFIEVPDQCHDPERLAGVRREQSCPPSLARSESRASSCSRPSSDTTYDRSHREGNDSSSSSSPSHK